MTNFPSTDSSVNNLKLITKINNLLARADERNNDNEFERIIALRQAEALMAKHAISHFNLSETEQYNSFGDLTDTLIRQDGSNIWPVYIMDRLGCLYRCRVIKLNSNQLRLFGHQSNIEILRSMTDYCVNSIRREMSIVYDGLMDEKPNRRRFNTSFGNGASVGIQLQVTELIAARDRGDIPQMELSKAMIVVDQYKKQLQQVNDHLQSVYPNLGKTRGSTCVDSTGYDSGKRYGQSLNLSGQLGSNAPGGLLL